jgi:hypothetical protein
MGDRCVLQFDQTTMQIDEGQAHLGAGSRGSHRLAVALHFRQQVLLLLRILRALEIEHPPLTGVGAPHQAVQPEQLTRMKDVDLIAAGVDHAIVPRPRGFALHDAPRHRLRLGSLRGVECEFAGHGLRVCVRPVEAARGRGMPLQQAVQRQTDAGALIVGRQWFDRLRWCRAGHVNQRGQREQAEGVGPCGVGRRAHGRLRRFFQRLREGQQALVPAGGASGSRVRLEAGDHQPRFGPRERHVQGVEFFERTGLLLKR